jgi:class 3 adenylate cyclase
LALTGWDVTVKRKLTTILCADVVGYSRLMGVDEAGTLKKLKSCREMMTGFVEHHHGRVVSWSGDAVLADFASVVESVQCAIEVQRELKARNETVPPSERMEFRIGINLGDVMVEDHDIFGEGVNIAARLQALAPPGGVLVSGSVHEQVKNKLTADFGFLGHQQVKNIATQVPAYVVIPERPPADPAAPPPPKPPEPVLAARAAAGATDGLIATLAAFAATLPLTAAGLPVADTSLPFGVLTTERVVSQEEPTTEIAEGGTVVITREPQIVNRTVLGTATQTYRVTATHTVTGGVSAKTVEDVLIDPDTGKPLGLVSVWWFAAAAYLGLMVLTEGVGRQRRSPGKSLFGLTVSSGGKPLSPGAAIVRNAAKIVSVLPVFAGLLLPVWTKRPQMLHDLAAGAEVTKG